MKTRNIYEAKTNLSRFLEEVQRGRPFIITKVSQPNARVISIDWPEPGEAKRLGFLKDQIKVPEDFDRMAEEKILAMFGETDAFFS